MHTGTFFAPRSRQTLRTPRWRRLVGAALVASPSLLAVAMALVSAAYLVSTGQSDTLVLARH